MQASAVKNNTFTREAYMRIIALKTAALFRAASTIGAKLAAANDAEIRALANFGFNLGLAFQIVDDILDMVADEDSLGKTSGLDILQGRGVATALRDANGNGVSPAIDPMASIRLKLMEDGTIEKARLEAGRLVDSAIANLAHLDDSPPKAALVELARQVVERDN